MRRLAAFVILATLFAVMSVACEIPTEEKTSREREADTREQAYDSQVSTEPAKTMDYSPTRKTINFWISTWDEPQKLSYVYLLASNGQLIGYYVLEGPPVSMCAALTPTWAYKQVDQVADVWFQEAAPSIDGVYYSGGQCNQYYGKDATSGAYVEFSIGTGINYLLYDQPLPRQDVEPLGFTLIGDVK